MADLLDPKLLKKERMKRLLELQGQWSEEQKQRHLLAAEAAKPLIFNCPAPVEKFPAEIKTMIMSHLDCNDMRALMHASPDFHKAYLGARDVLFTQATFRTLLLRGIDLSNIHPMIEICLQGRGSQDFGNPTKELRYILHKIFMHYSDFEPLPVIGDTGMPFLHYEECLELLQIIDIMERPVDLSFHTDIEVCVKFGKHFQRDRFKYGRHNYRLAYVGEIRGHYREISMEHVVEYGTGQPMEIFAYAAWVYWDHANGVGCDERCAEHMKTVWNRGEFTRKPRNRFGW